MREAERGTPTPSPDQGQRFAALSGASRPARRPRVELAWLLLVAVLSGGLFLARYDDPRRIAASGDAYWYLRQAQIFAGTDPAAASTRASELVCRDIDRAARRKGSPRYCRDGYPQRGVSPRYIAIFDSRPGYPLFAAPFVKLLGAWRGMMLATMLLGVLVGILAYLAVLLAFGRRSAGVGAAVLIYLLPSGFWITRMLAEGAMLVGCLGVILGVTLLWRGHWRAGPVLTVTALTWLFLAKSANGVALALVLVVVAATALVIRPRNRRVALVTGGVGLLALAGWYAISHLFALPSLNETIQDFATKHFTRPDTADPIGFLVQRNLTFWPAYGRNLISSPLPLVAVGLSALVFVARARPVVVLWTAAGLSGLALVVAHPVATEYDRLMLPMWLPVAAALGYAVAVALSAPWTPWGAVLRRSPRESPVPAARETATDGVRRDVAEPASRAG
ncbi:hypothetical protein V6U90_08820 [Micromonospora sp. CPCC 206060]|uniref:hypothetical protein n=1 Tax=Micromonospora sp. CPCC 206060 TaxID=3122406 RepID=UPI002FF0CD66